MFHLCLVDRGYGQLHMAPIPPNPHRILDLGTGTGIWAIEMGWPIRSPVCSLALTLHKATSTLRLMYASRLANPP
jgi:hypothetical protein